MIVSIVYSPFYPIIMTNQGDLKQVFIIFLLYMAKMGFHIKHILCIKSLQMIIYIISQLSLLFLQYFGS